MANDVIFFYTGKQEYLIQSIKQFKHYNPDKTIHFIGQHINENVLQLVKFYKLEDLLCNQSYRYLNNFKNYSTNDANFEKSAILRWFCIRNLCLQENFSSIFTTDCDIMYYCSIDEESKKFSNYLFSIAAKSSGHTVFINDINVLDDYCLLIEKFYDSKKEKNLNLNIKSFDMDFYFQQAITNYNIRRQFNLPGGICDMTFWGKLKEIYHAGAVGEVCDIINDSSFDHTISECDGYEMDNNIKKIKFINNVPYCYNTFLKKDIKFNSIHFQGYHMKSLMERYKTYV